MPPFTLAPWELPPDCQAPLTAPADFVFRASWQRGCCKNPRKTEIWLRVVPHEKSSFYFFCNGRSPQNGNWMLSLENIDFKGRELSIEFLQSCFERQTFWTNVVGRRVFFEGTPYGRPGPHFVTVWANGSGVITRGTFTQQEARATFDFPFARKIPTKAATMRKELLATLHDEFSELRFALDWLYLSRDQKRELLLRFGRGTFCELETLLRAALQSQIGLWENNEPVLWFTNNPTSYADVREMTLTGPFPMPRNISTPARLNFWKETLWNYFQPSPNQDLLRFSAVARASARILCKIELEVAPPTAHERLEALLLLRDWWQQNFPSQPFEEQNADTPD